MISIPVNRFLFPLFQIHFYYVHFGSFFDVIGCLWLGREWCISIYTIGAAIKKSKRTRKNIKYCKSIIYIAATDKKRQ